MNSYIKTAETEIDLLDLGKYLLHRIAWILLAGFVCAVLAGGYKYYDMKTGVSDPEAVAEAETEYELGVEKYQRQSELIASSDESTAELIRVQEEYLRTSPFMKLDPYHVWRAETLVRVVSDSEDFSAYHIEELYRLELRNAQSLEALSDALGTEQAYLSEMYSVNLSGVTLLQNATLQNEPAGDVSHDQGAEDGTDSIVFTIRTIGNTQDEAMDLMSALLEELDAARQKYEKEYPHALQVFTTSCVQTVDTSVRAVQRDAMTYTQNLLYQMKDNVDKGTALTEPAKESPAQAGAISAGSLLKFGLIGFVAGVFLMCLWYALRYILNNKLVDYKDIERKGMYLKELGTITNQGIAMAAANIRNFAGGRKRLFLTGMTSDAEFDKTCGSLKEYLSEFEIVYARDVVHDPNSREKLLDCDAAVLVEQKGVTRYSDMKEEITFLVNAGKEIIGVVIA